jgi:flagellar motor switch protein FliN
MMSEQPLPNPTGFTAVDEARREPAERSGDGPALPQPVNSPEQKDHERENAQAIRTISKEQLFSLAESDKLGLIMDVSLLMAVELGRTRLTVREILDLHKGSVIELDRMAGEVVDVFVSDQMMAHGEVVVVGDKFGVRITEIVTPETKAGGV